MKILIIEDDRELAEALKRSLGRYYVIELAETAAQSMELIEEHDFGLIILDLNLPDVPGLELCSTLRSMALTMPILVVTGDHSPRSHVDLLDTGADDYITKPFRVEVLQARVRALTRRQAERQTPANRLAVGDMTLDTDRHCLEINNLSIPLRHKEFIILEELMRHPNIVLSRASLMNKAWDSRENTWGNIVDVHIKNLRDKIDRPFGTNRLQTVHGLGYRLIVRGI